MLFKRAFLAWEKRQLSGKPEGLRILFLKRKPSLGFCVRHLHLLWWKEVSRGLQKMMFISTLLKCIQNTFFLYTVFPKKVKKFTYLQLNFELFATEFTLTLYFKSDVHSSPNFLNLAKIHFSFTLCLKNKWNVSIWYWVNFNNSNWVDLYTVFHKWVSLI